MKSAYIGRAQGCSCRECTRRGAYIGRVCYLATVMPSTQSRVTSSAIANTFCPRSVSRCVRRGGERGARKGLGRSSSCCACDMSPPPTITFPPPTPRPPTSCARARGPPCSARSAAMLCPTDSASPAFSSRARCCGVDGGHRTPGAGIATVSTVSPFVGGRIGL